MKLEDLKSLIVYLPETGEFLWRKNHGKMKEGDLVGWVTAQGYRRGFVLGKFYLLHRLAFFYMNGVWPKLGVDHINGMKADNRWVNLREVSQSVNMQNLKGPRKDNVLGLLGVSKHKNKFVARIKIGGVLQALRAV